MTEKNIDNKKLFYKKISEIQKKLNVNKNRTHYKGWKYRNAEDILESTKPILDGLVLTLSEEMIIVSPPQKITQNIKGEIKELIHERIYVRATATITDGEYRESAHAHARESMHKQGLDDPQLTGTASSYAKKYALCHLLGIDDGLDSDSLPPDTTPPKKQIEKKEKPNLNKRVHDLCAGMSPDEKKKILKDLTYRSQEKDGKKMEAYIADPVTLKTNLGTFPRPETLERIIKELEAIN